MIEEIDKRTDTQKDKDQVEMVEIAEIEVIEETEIEGIEGKEIDQDKENNLRKENTTDKVDSESIKKDVIKKVEIIEKAETTNNIRKSIEKIGQDLMKEIETIDI